MGLQNTRPVIHDIYEPTSDTWQYVIADQFTKRCIVINPVHEISKKDDTGIATTSPDSIVALVKRQGYVVDWLLETQPNYNRRTSVYYLRMQLLEAQGFAPRTCGGTNIRSMKKLFQRKYGDRNKLETDFHHDLEDGDNFWVGNMQVSAVKLDGLQQEHVGYVVGEYLFGLSWFTQLTGLESTLDDSSAAVLRLRNLWFSMAKVMAYPPYYRIYLENGSSAFGDGEPFTTVQNSRQSNRFGHMEESDFVNHWKAQLKSSRPDSSTRPSSRRRLPSPLQKIAAT